MASWIAHLRIAENLLEKIPALDESMFAVGNIAPDSGTPDAKWEKFKPPPPVTHFQDSEDVHRNCHDLEFYRRYMASPNLQQNPRQFSFLLGYFFHLITDNLWSIRVGRPTRERFDAEFNADNNFIWEVKRDWYGLDFVYLREHPESLFWRVFLHADFEDVHLDFLPDEAIRDRIAYIQQYYLRSDDETLAMAKRPFIYLSKDEMDDFVQEASDRIFAIYQCLWINHGDAVGHLSALTMGV